MTVVLTDTKKNDEMLKRFFQTPAEGARTAVYLATSPLVSEITGEYFYRCQIAKSSKSSKDMELAKRLYELSAKMTGLNR